MYRVVLILVSLILTIGNSYGQKRMDKTAPFHTIGYDYQRPSSMVLPVQADSLDVEDYTEEGNVCEPSVDSIKSLMPLVSLPLRSIKVTSPFGMRRDPMNKSKKRFHAGVDLRARYEEVYSMLPGTVSAATNSMNGGKYITIDHGVCSCSYLHLSKIKVSVGQHVRAGEVIGISGNTGKRTTGPHLHISVRHNGEGRKYFNPMLILGFVSEQLQTYQSSN